MMSRRAELLCRWLLPLILGSAGAAAFGQPQAQEVTLKAEIVHRAMLFIEWPASSLRAAQPLALCVLDEGALATSVLALAGRMVNGHPLETRRVARPEQLASCHAALVGAAFETAAALAGRPVLIVSEAPSMLGRGVMLNLQIEDGRVVFDVGLDSAHRAGLEISTKLLRLARYVRKN